MSTFRTPVGPQPSNVYWRRRLAVGAGLVAVIVIIMLIVFAPKGGESPSSAGVKTPAPAESAAAAPAELKACEANDLTVTATIDKAKYTVEEQPKFGFTITNNGSEACNATAGSDVQVFTVTSGKETIWTSVDCQSAPVAFVTAIQPGEQATGGPIPWDRTRSSKTTCDATRSPVTAAGASYHVDVTVNGLASEESPQFILN